MGGSLPDSQSLSLDQTVSILRAAGEPTRLRLLALLSESDLTVSDLIEILGQSQPRISRHLKLLTEARLLERYQEGAWAFFRLGEQGNNADLVQQIIGNLDLEDPNFVRDRQRLNVVRQKRAARAAEYFSRSASDWDTIRSLHIDEQMVENAMLDMVGADKFGAMLDLGTGTGRVLELFAGLYSKAVGIDASRDMLAVARSRLDEANLSRVQTRQGDLYLLPTKDGNFDLVTIHQVLHYLEDPAGAIQEASKALNAGGRLLIVDFAPHDLEFLRQEHAHLRMGFDDSQIDEWLEDAGMKMLEHRHLKPALDSEDALTVCLWLAGKA